ncbi:hypothetical protein [Hyphomonas sp.]|uniref:hypothetical protein n=1 Tax=Hyphomonas sp. TaxID=87 RepID=UPI001BD073A3|nr:hypothetical protein [Hyphomonas sp.]
MLKWVIRLIVAIVSIVVLTGALLAGLPWLGVVAERIGSEPYRNHLSANEVVLDLSAPDAGLQLRADDLDARYVLLGEMHGYALPQQLDTALVTYLQAEGPPRWYLAEMTPREAIAVNEYLSGGSDIYARAVFDRFAESGLQWANKEFFQKLTSLRGLNETLPADRQIRFIGIDLDREGDPLQLPEAGGGTGPNLGDPSTARAINEALLRVPIETRNRYNAMKARLTALAEMPGFADARFAGLWGFFHASEAPINGVEPLSLWLQDAASPYAGDVVTINSLCVGECFNMMPAAALPDPMKGPNEENYTWVPMGMENPYFQRPKGISDFMHALGDDRAALYRLGGDASPYNESNRLAASSGYLVMMNPWDVSGTTTQMTDYVLVYRDTAPLYPWSGTAFDLSGAAATAK